MKMNLKDREWAEFVLEEIFQIDSTSSGIDRNKLNNKTGDIPYVTRSDKSNGYDSFVSEQGEKYNLDNANVISIGLDTQTVFYQPNRFYTGQNLQILSNPFLNKYNSSFIISLLKIQMKKFNWGGNGATLTRLRRSKMLLPTLLGKPDYGFMELYIQYHEKNKLEDYINYIEKYVIEFDNNKLLSFSEKKWKEFGIEEIAEIVSGKDIYEAERVKGDVPYITATASNNGIGYFVGNNNETLEANCLSVNRNGSVGYSFYHNYPALFSNDCRKLRLKNNSKYVGIFIAQQISSQRAKYGYGYKMGTARLKQQKIMLPVNSKLQPDYDFMEAYMRNLERQKIEKYKKHILSRISELEVKFVGGGVRTLNEFQWGAFKLNQIFLIENCKCSNVSNLRSGSIPYVGATNRNNGVIRFVEREEKLVTKGNCLAFICDGEGSVGLSIYKSEDFIGSTTVKVGRSENLNKYVAMFIATIADTVRSKYNFGFKRNESHLKNEVLLLPITSKGAPDYIYMEDYMQQLEYRKLKNILKYIN